MCFTEFSTSSSVTSISMQQLSSSGGRGSVPCLVTHGCTWMQTRGVDHVIVCRTQVTICWHAHYWLTSVNVVFRQTGTQHHPNLKLTNSILTIVFFHQPQRVFTALQSLVEQLHVQIKEWLPVRCTGVSPHLNPFTQTIHLFLRFWVWLCVALYLRELWLSP